MIIGIDRGHNSGKDMGAVGLRIEGDMINEVAHPLIDLLRKDGHTVYDITGDGRTLTNRVVYANTLPLDLIVSIHFNAFNGVAKGTEVLYKSTRGKALAEPIQRAIVALGFTDRGVKYRDNLHILNATKAPTVLVEGCFCDSKVDMALYNVNNMVNAIYKGITGKEVIDYKVMYFDLYNKLRNTAEASRYVEGNYQIKYEALKKAISEVK